MAKRQGIQLCYPFEISRLEKWSPPYIIQPKLDGERCRAVYVNGGYQLFSSEMHVIESVPHINLTLNEWARKQPYQPEFDGELYRHGWSFEEVHSVVGRTVNLHQHFELMRFHVFDLPMEAPQCERQIALTKLMRQWPNDHVKMVPFKVVNTLEEIMEYYRECLDNGFEGIILRHFEAPYVRRRSTFVMKFKPKKEDIYEIIELVEAIDKYGARKNMLGAIRCAGDDRTIFNVGAGQLTHKQRTDYWNDKSYWEGKTIRVGYQNLTETGGVPRFGIAIELIDEVFEKSSSGFFNPLLK